MLTPRLLAALVASIAFANSLRAADAPLPSPGDVKSLAIHPAKVALIGSDAAAQLVVTATLTDGRLVDLTHDVKYAVADGKVAACSPTGRVLPLANGTTEIVATFGDKTAQVPLETKSIDENLPINFANQIVPIFTKLGCNRGGCHGKASGQNGFTLSLLGFEPELDLHDARQGRPRPAALPRRPGQQPAAAQGDRHAWPTAAASAWKPAPTSTSSIRRWIAAGTPFGKRDRPDRHQDHASSPSTAS